MFIQDVVCVFAILTSGTFNQGIVCHCNNWNAYSGCSMTPFAIVTSGMCIQDVVGSGPAPK